MPPLRIDAAALAELELAPNTSLAKLTLPKTEDAVRRGIAWLEHFQLALVAGPDGCWLTSSAALLSDVEQNGRVLFRNVFANESPIWESPSTPDVAHARRWLTVTDWIAAEPQPRSPWRSANHGFDAGELAGWRRVHVELIRPELATLRVYRPSVIRGWSWAMFLCVVGASGWVVRRRHSWLAPLLAIAVGVVLVVPVEWIPIGQAMFWGALLVAISNRYWRHAETPARNTAENSSSHIASRAALAGTVAGLFVGVIVLASTARSADDAAPPIAYRVLVPIDDKRQPVGDYVHLPREFYHALRERGAAAELGGDEWFVVAAEYRGSLMRAAGGDGFDISDFQMQFDLDVRRAGVRVRLPLPEAAVALQANGCRLDGEPIVVEWDRDGHQLEFVVAATGTHKLELALQPLLRPSPRDAGRTGFSFGIPRAPHGRLELRLPRDVVDVTVPSALGAIVVDRNAGTLVAELGPANELTVQWPAQSADVLHSSEQNEPESGGPSVQTELAHALPSLHGLTPF